MELLTHQFAPAEFEPDLCDEIIERIIYKNPDIDHQRAQDLAVIITTSTGFLCSAFEYGFVDEIDALVGTPAYTLRVFMSRYENRYVD